MPDQPIVVYQNDIHVQNSGWTSPPAELEDIKFYIKAGLPDSVQKLLPSLYLTQDGNLLSLEHARILSMTLLSSAVNVANDIGIPLNDLFSDPGSSFMQILLKPSSRDLCNETGAFLTRLTTQIAECRTNKSKSALWDILQYIQANLTDASLSLGSVAETFQLFKPHLHKGAGIQFLQILKQASDGAGHHAAFHHRLKGLSDRRSSRHSGCLLFQQLL
jgi:hypothetical protein